MSRVRAFFRRIQSPWNRVHSVYHGVKDRRRRRREFWRDFHEYARSAPPGRKPWERDVMPFLEDKTRELRIEPVYYYQDAWAFERIVAARPSYHVDVGSHHKYVALLSKVVPVASIEFRLPSLPLETLDSVVGSITELPFGDGSIESLSSLCVVEHIGLGRYGDPIDPYGSERAIRELIRVLAPDGTLYVSVPVADEEKVMFNAGRIFAREHFLDLLSELTRVDERYIVNDSYQEEFVSTGGFGTTGLYEFRKPRK